MGNLDKIKKMDCVPFDVLCHTLRCFPYWVLVSGHELVELRRMSRTWKRGADLPHVQEAWRARSASYLAWQLRTGRFWPTMDRYALVKLGGESRGRFGFGGAVVGRMAVQLALSHPRPQVEEPLLEEDEEDGEFMLCSEEAQDEDSNGWNVDLENELEWPGEVWDEGGKPASWNSLHWTLACIGQLHEWCSNNGTLGVFEKCHLTPLFPSSNTVEYADLVNERCCVTGMTPLMVFVSQAWVPEFWDLYGPKIIDQLQQIGADFGVLDNGGRSAADWFVLTRFPFEFFWGHCEPMRDPRWHDRGWRREVWDDLVRFGAPVSIRPPNYYRIDDERVLPQAEVELFREFEELASSFLDHDSPAMRTSGYGNSCVTLQHALKALPIFLSTRASFLA